MKWDYRLEDEQYSNQKQLTGVACQRPYGKSFCEFSQNRVSKLQADGCSKHQLCEINRKVDVMRLARCGKPGKLQPEWAARAAPSWKPQGRGHYDALKSKLVRSKFFIKQTKR